MIEVLPNSTSISAPGWAYVPDTGYDPSKAPIQPSGSRKRNARISGVAGGDTTARQNNVLMKRLADLDRDNHKDIQIALPPRAKDANGRGAYRTSTHSHVTSPTCKAAPKGKTPITRKILLAQKTFANYVADEEALAALEQPSPATPKPRTPGGNLRRRSSAPARESPSSTAKNISTIGASSNPQKPSNYSNIQTAALSSQDSDDARLLESVCPMRPSEDLLEALVTAPPLLYNAARVGPSSSGRPQRHFCEICGYWGRVKCMKCGARVCGLTCKTAHDDGRCTNFYG